MSDAGDGNGVYVPTRSRFAPLCDAAAQTSSLSAEHSEQKEEEPGSELGLLPVRGVQYSVAFVKRDDSRSRKHHGA